MVCEDEKNQLLYLLNLFGSYTNTRFSLTEDNSLFGKKTYTKQDCAELAKHLMHESSLPAQCQKYNDVVGDLRRRDSDVRTKTHGRTECDLEDF